MRRRSVLVMLAMAACVQSNAVPCGDGRTCPENTACDDAHHTCVAPEQLQMCIDEEVCTAGDATGVCDQNVCIVQVCGDGFQQAPELCDGEDRGTGDCTDFGFYTAGRPGCNDACNYDLNTCSGFCGDGDLNGPEICETDVALTKTCVDYGFGAGALTCDGCGPGTGDCKTFGWRTEDVEVRPIEVHGLSDTDIYVAGRDGLLHFDGVSWQRVDLTDCGAETLAFDQVWEAAPGVVFATNDAVVVRVDGTTCTKWMVIAGITDIWATSATDAWAIALPTSGGTAGGVFHLNGTTWSMSSALPGVSLWGSSANDIWAVTNNNLVAHFDGTQWSTPALPPNTSEVHAVWGTSATEVYFGGVEGFDPAVVLYNGSTYAPLLSGTHPLFAGADGIAAYGWTANGRTFVSVLRVRFGTLGTVILEYDGTGWTNLRAPVFGSAPIWVSQTGTVYTSVSLMSDTQQLAVLERNVRNDFPDTFVGGSQVVALASDDAYLATGNGVLHWDGASWTTELNNVLALLDIAVSTAGDVFALNARVDQGLYRKTSSGWVQTTGASGTAVSAVDANNAWVLDALTLHHWTAPDVVVDAAIPSPNGDFMLDVYAASNTSVFVVGQGGSIFHYDGSTWTTMTSNTTAMLVSLWGRSATDVYAAGDGVVLHYDGASWTALPAPPASNNYSIWGTASDDLFIGTLDGLFHFDGVAWNPVASGGFGIETIGGAGDSVFFSDSTGAMHQLVRTADW